MNPKAVLINDLCVFRQRSGVAHYTRELIRHLGASGKEVQVVRLSRTVLGAPLRILSELYETGRRVGGAGQLNDYAPTGTTRPLVGRCVQLARRFGHSAVDQYLSLMPRLGKWSIYHEPDAIPLPIKAPTVTTFHDLSVLLYPHWHPKHRVLKYERNLRAGIEQTALFLAVSGSTKRDMIRHLAIPEERIRVVPEAPRPMFRELPVAIVDAVRARLGLPQHYLLFLGTIEPRKNVAGMLRAYARIPASLRVDYPLVLAGGWGWQSRDVQEMLTQSPWQESVRWLGYLADEALVAVINGAAAVVYPSFYEGFGLPPLEAMACGRPVITTHAGSLAEVVADAAIIIDPHDEDQLARAMTELLENPELAREYRERGRRHLQNFSWHETARQTLEAYRLVA